MTEPFGRTYGLTELDVVEHVRGWAEPAARPFDPAEIARLAAAGSRGASRPAHRRGPDPRLALLVAAGLALLALIGIGLLAGRPHLPGPLGRNGTIAVDGGGTISAVTTGGATHALAQPAGMEWRPTWSRDGTRVAYWSAALGASQARCPVPVDAAARIQSQAADPSCAFDADLVVLDPATGRGTTVAGRVPLPGAIAWSPDGTRLAYASEAGITVAGLDGAPGVVVGLPGLRSSDPAWSPDGATIAYAAGGNDQERGIYLVAPDGGPSRRLTGIGVVHDGAPLAPRWSPDGRHLAYIAVANGSDRLWLIDADGLNEHAAVTYTDPARAHDLWPAWSPDGKWIALLRGDLPDCCDAVARIIPTDGKEPEFDVTSLPFGYVAPAWSPDGTRVAFAVRGADHRANTRIALLDPTGRNPPTLIEVPSGFGSIGWQWLPPDR